MNQKPAIPLSVLGWVFLMLLFGTFFALLLALAHATEAPGCGNQHYRPRLAQCCPKYLAGEDLPPKCTHALADGFLEQCCRNEHATPTPITTPTQTCPPDWRCWPTPTPTSTYAIVTDKGSCCRQVLTLYQEARHAIVDEKRAELKELLRWKQAAMRQCREDYAR